MTASDDLPGDVRRSAFDPDLVEHLLDGQLEPDDAPDALAGIAALVRTARSPATAAELMDEPRVLQAMAAAPVDATGVPSSGRLRMITQVTRTKAAAIVVLSALGVGAVAAAVTANKPKDHDKAGPTTDPIVVTVPATEPEATLPETVPETAPETTVGDETATTTSTTPTAIAAQVAEQGQGPDATGPAAYGLCTAWSAHQRNGAQPNGVAFRNLDDAAAAKGMTTADYCALVIAEKKGTGTETQTAAIDTDEQNDKPKKNKENNGNGPPADRPGATAPGQNKP
jgi:hypothetical protein